MKNQPELSINQYHQPPRVIGSRGTHQVAACSGRRESVSAPPGHAGLARWYALQVRPTWAPRIQRAARELGIEEFLPTIPERVRWSDRDKTIERPVFPGYLFVRLGSAEQRSSILHVAGVIEMLPSRGSPIAIDDAEIISLRTAIAQPVPVALCPYVAGETVTIDSGPLAGVSGTIVRIHDGHHLVVGIQMLGRAVSVKVDQKDVKK